MDKIAVLIPCYNESLTIQKVVRDFQAALPEATVYVYDNNSTDDSAALARQAGAVVRREYKRGKGNVIRRMFREVDALCYIMADGDDTYPADCAREMARQVLERQADMVVGDRLSSTYFTENKRLFHNSGNSLVRFCVNWLFGSDIRDIMTGYRAFSYQFVKTYAVLATGFEIETEMTIHAVDKNMQVENVVVAYRDRPAGSCSKLNTCSDGLRVLRTIGALFRDYRPLQFFSALAGGLLLLSLAFFLPVLVEFTQTALVPRIPTLIMCGFTALAGVLAFFAGLELETIRKKNRQDFELELHRAQDRLKDLLEREKNKEGFQ